MSTNPKPLVILIGEDHNMNAERAQICRNIRDTIPESCFFYEIAIDQIIKSNDDNLYIFCPEDDRERFQILSSIFEGNVLSKIDKGDIILKSLEPYESISNVGGKVYLKENMPSQLNELTRMMGGLQMLSESKAYVDGGAFHTELDCWNMGYDNFNTYYMDFLLSLDPAWKDKKGKSFKSMVSEIGHYFETNFDTFEKLKLIFNNKKLRDEFQERCRVYYYLIFELFMYYQNNTNPETKKLCEQIIKAKEKGGNMVTIIDIYRDKIMVKTLKETLSRDTSCRCAVMIVGDDHFNNLNSELLKEGFTVESFSISRVHIADSIRKVAEIKNKIFAIPKTPQQLEADKAKEEGNNAFKKKDYSVAIDLYSRAISIDPTNAAYFLNRCMSFIEIQKFEEALSDANMAIQLKPDYFKAYNKKVLALISMGRFDEAVIAIDEYEKVDKANGGKNSGDIKNLRDKTKRGGMRLTYRQIRKHNKRTKKNKKTKKYKKNKKTKKQKN
jgi:tetratricopeptide (TPR) repeat protein